MQCLRTSDDRFSNLLDFPFAPHDVEVDDGEGGHLRVHHLDEGPRAGNIVLLMHGEPSWCAGQPHTTIAGGGHFLQEDRGEEPAKVVAEWID
jgi:hypothetical protein